MTELRAATLRKGVVLLFLASGFSGLVYQVAWVRLLTPVFGVTAYAISTVLASFMGGLALGSFVFGRFIDGRKDPLRLYALLEAGIGVYALLIPFLFGLTNDVVRVVYHAAGEGSPVVFGLLRACIAFLILVIPTTLMGATLPVLCKFFIETLDRVGRETGKLYFINTLGAVIGCATAGFFLIPEFGLHVAIGIAALINLGVGVVAYGMHRRSRPPEVATAAAPAASPHRSFSWIVVAFALSGLTALILEVIWTRVLILIFGSTVYSFAAMLSVFLLGIALGGALFGRIADRVKSPYRLLGTMQAAIALIVLAEAATINHLPGLFLRMLATTGVQDSSMTLIKFVISFAVLFPVTLVSGGTFPVVAKAYSDSLRHTGRDIGLIYSMNTVGAIVGSLLAGFAIVPLIGMRHGLMVAAWLTLLTGAVTLLVPETNARPKPLLVTGFLAVGLAGTLLLPAWNTALLSIPVWFQPREYIGRDGKFDLNEVIRETKNLFYAEGVNDTIIVTATPTARILSINGKVIATSSWRDMLHLKMLGHLPVLIHPGKPRTAINIGLGVGGTVSGLAAHDVEKVYGVELETKVVQANPYFAEANDSVLKNPKFQIVVADGRNYLSMSKRKYDIISSDPFEPFMTGAGDLYSKEFFELGRSRLNHDGIMTQWVPLHQTADPEFRSLLKSFIAVFPHCTVWFSGESVILIGSETRLSLDPAVMRNRMAEPGAVSTLKRLGLDTPEQLLTLLVADETSLAPYLEGVPLNTDGFPFVEYSSARSILAKTTGINLRRMSAHYISPDAVLDYVAPGAATVGTLDVPRTRTLLAAMRLGIDGMVDSLEGQSRAAFDKLTDATAVSGNPFLTDWLVSMHERAGRASQDAGDMASASAHFEEAVRLAPDGFIGLASLGFVRFLTGDSAAARPLLERAYELAPTSAVIAMRLGAVYDALGDAPRARQLYEQAVAHRPDLGLPLSLLAVHEQNAGNLAEAERLFRLSLERTPGDAATQEALIQTILAQNRFDEAEQACLDLVKRHPERAAARTLLGMIGVSRGNLPAAKASFLSAIEADPKDAEGHYQLSRVEMALGETDHAVQSLKRAIALGGDAFAGRARGDETLAAIVSEATR